MQRPYGNDLQVRLSAHQDLKPTQANTQRKNKQGTLVSPEAVSPHPGSWVGG